MGQRPAGKIDVELVPGTVFQYHGRLCRDAVPVQYLTELAVGIMIVGTCLPVLLPQQLTGHTGPFQLLGVMDLQQKSGLLIKSHAAIF